MMKMLNKDEWMRLSELVSEISVAQERAFVVINEMENHFFDLTNEAMILYFHKDSGIQADIVMDYLFRMREPLHQIGELLSQGTEAGRDTGRKEDR